MTDLPRRSYPLVVAPPGGFEDAVRRGRRLRRRRAGGSSGLALVLAGALGWSVLGGGSGIDRIEPTREDRRDRTAPAPGFVAPPTFTPPPTQPSNVRPGAVASPSPGTIGGPRATTAPTTVTPPPTRKPGGGGAAPSRRYAARPEIDRGRPQTNTNTSCLYVQDMDWCATANVDDSRGPEGIYVLSYSLCRTVNAGDGKLTFDYKQEIEFRATDTKNNDTVWTYSAGQRRVREPETLTVPSGQCVTWTTEWDGQDDFGYTPTQGTYVMQASPLSRESVIAADDEFTHY